MPNTIYINFTSPANSAVLSFLGIAEPDKSASYKPEEVNLWGLDTHPDLVDYLWGLPGDASPNCACVIDQRSKPLLVHPTSGIIFGLAGGTSTLALRLPEPERSTMLTVADYGAKYEYPKSTVYAKHMGEDWVLLKPFDKGNVALCQKALEYAGTLR
jgi:hypothetical protein